MNPRRTPAVDGIERAARAIDPVFLRSPQLAADAIGAQHRCRLVCKIETLNPIRSFKGRGAEWFVHELGPAPLGLVCASAGNFGQGLAWAARRHGISLVVFAGHGANPRKVERMRALGATVELAGADFDGAKDAARTFAEVSGARFVEDGREPEVAEGAGTIARELLEWPDRFDDLLVPVGNGSLIIGIGTWLRHASPATKVLGVAASGAPAMERSWRERQPVTTAGTSTIADGIAVRVPVPEALDDMRPVVDEMLLVSDAQIERAMQLGFAEFGIVVEPAGAAGIAALLAEPQRFVGRTVGTVLCGSNIADAQVGRLIG